MDEIIIISNLVDHTKYNFPSYVLLTSDLNQLLMDMGSNTVEKMQCYSYSRKTLQLLESPCKKLQRRKKVQHTNLA